MLRRGDLKHTVNFYEQHRENGKYGKENTPALYYRCRAKVKQISSKGRVVDGKETLEDSFVIKIFTPKSKKLHDGLTVQYRGNTLNVTGVHDAHPELHIYAKVVS